MKVERFEDLIAWQKARVLTKDVYLTTMDPRFERDFALCGQIRKSAISVPSNIAEGFERGGRREFHQFLSVAKGSCAELRTQIYIAADVGYIDDSTAKRLLAEATEVGKIIGGLRKAVAHQRTQSSVLSPQS
jgi:four helix bundle protein